MSVPIEIDDLPLEGIDLHSSVLEILTCPVCSEPMVGAIFQCDKGHVICDLCYSGSVGKKATMKCPDCSSKFSDIQCVPLESLAQRMRWDCPYRGCNQQYSKERIREHQLSCPKRPIKCLECDMTFVDSRALFGHLRENHDETAFKLGRHSFYISSGKEIDSGEVFVWNKEIEHEGKFFRFTMEVCGSYVEARVMLLENFDCTRFASLKKYSLKTTGESQEKYSFGGPVDEVGRISPHCLVLPLGAANNIMKENKTRRKQPAIPLKISLS